MGESFILSRQHGLVCVMVVPVLLGGHQACASEAGSGIAIDSDSVSATIESLDSFEAEQERLKKLLADKPRAYQDKVMDSRDLAGLAEEEADSGGDEDETEGLHSVVLESRVDLASSSVSGSDFQRAGSAGVRLEYRHETMDLGEFVWQVDARGRSDDQTAMNSGSMEGKPKNVRATVRNLGLPVAAEVLADTAVGDIGSEVTQALGRNYRVALGASPVRGVGTHVYSEKFDLRAGTGVRGELRGGPYPGFEATQGNLSWLGYSQRAGENLLAGVQVNQAKDIPVTDVNGIATSQGTEDVTSVAASLGYGKQQADGGRLNARATVVSSKASAAVAGRNQGAKGVFVEAGVEKGRYRHEMGAYAGDSNLRFGDNLLLSGSRGAFWRVDHGGSRLNLGGGLEVEQYAPTGNTRVADSRRVGLNAHAQYRIDRDDMLGGSLQAHHLQADGNAADGSSGSRSANLNLHYQTRFRQLGRSRFSATLHRNETLVSNGAAATGDELQWEQDWITGKYETMRPELTTTVGIAHDRSVGETQTYPTAAVNARYWLDADWNVAGNLRYTSRTGNLSTSQGMAGTLATEYALGKEWQLGAALSLNEARVDFSGNSLLEPAVMRTSDKQAYAYLRWQKTSGKPYQKLGGKSAGSGEVSGAVFFDANQDGEQQADEASVPNVEVVLDGTYRVVTDARGGFRFSAVTVGQHSLGLNLDTVPLPWGEGKIVGSAINVPLRGQVSIKIPLIKING